MGKFRKLDTSPGRVNRQMRDLRRALDEQRAARRLPGSAVEEGTDFSVRGVLRVVGSAIISGALDLTGTLSMKSDDGAEMIRMGGMTFGRGLSFTRSDGTPAFELRKVFSNSTRETWEWRDSAGNPVIAENTIGPGLSRPLLEMPFQPYATSSGTAVSCGPYGFERTTTSGSWETLFAYDGKAQNQLIDFKFAALCSDATTEGEVQVVDLDTGTPRPGYLISPWVGTIPAGTTAMTVLDPAPDKVISLVDVVGAGGYQRLGVQVRRTTGTGSITLAVAQAIGG